MSRYAVYKLFDGCNAPENITSCGYLAGVFVGESDDNPLYRREDASNRYLFQILSEFNPETDIRLTAKSEEGGRVMNGEICEDGRFELIEKARKKLFECTNIKSSTEEVAVLDSILFRCWQMGWLDQLREEDER